MDLLSHKVFQFSFPFVILLRLCGTPQLKSGRLLRLCEIYGIEIEVRLTYVYNSPHINSSISVLAFLLFSFHLMLLMPVLPSPG